MSEKDMTAKSNPSARAVQFASIDTPFSAQFVTAAIKLEIHQDGHLDFLPKAHDPFHSTRMELSQSPKKHQPARHEYLRAASWDMDPSRADITPMQERLAESSQRVAQKMDKTFQCSAGVQTALAQIGLNFWGCGDALQMGEALQNSGKFQLIPESEARRGDIGVQAWSPGTVRAYSSTYHGRNLGDIFVVQHNSDGRITQSNDHLQGFNPNNRQYDPSKRYFLRIMS